MDLQFPNGQLTYVAGEGLNASSFLPIFGGLLQVQGRLPGETRVSFSCKVRTSITARIKSCNLLFMVRKFFSSLLPFFLTVMSSSGRKFIIFLPGAI